MSDSLIRVLAAASLLALPSVSLAFEPPPDSSSLNKAFEGESYSPYAARSFPNRPLWGDTHLHTCASFDAGAFGNRLDARAAYRFAKGEEVEATTGMKARLPRPLDWLVVANRMRTARCLQSGIRLMSRARPGPTPSVRLNLPLCGPTQSSIPISAPSTMRGSSRFLHLVGRLTTPSVST